MTETADLSLPDITGPTRAVAERNAQAVAARFYNYEPFVYTVDEQTDRFGPDGDSVILTVKAREGSEAPEGWRPGDPDAVWGEDVDAPRAMRVTGEPGKPKPPRPTPTPRPTPPAYDPWQWRLGRWARLGATITKCAVLGHDPRGRRWNGVGWAVEYCTRCGKGRRHEDGAGWGPWRQQEGRGGR